ncbi:MAG: metal ABC transporter substrate-binding protein [Myxococcota bacterium]
MTRPPIPHRTGQRASLGTRARSAAWRSRLAAALAFVAIPLTDCRPVLDPSAQVVVTVYPLELLVRELGGERVGVATLVPPGASPHAFTPAPTDLASLSRAALFVRVGAGFDDWAARLAAVAPDSLETLALLEIRGVEPLAGDDPHVWLDPILVRDTIVPELARRLARMDPAGADAYRQRARSFSKRLGALDAEIRLALPGDGGGYIAYHNAWRHFARRYALAQVAVVQEFAGEEPTPRELARLIGAARAGHVRAILVEPQLSPRAARVVAAEFGGGTRVVDPLGDPEDRSRSSYEALMRFNAHAFAEALGGERS